MGISVLAAMLASVALWMSGSTPASAQSDEPRGEDAYGAPTLSTGDRLADRRYVATGDRAYVTGTQDGSFPAMGFHTRGEMGGIWAPPIKLLDGIWFSVDGKWLPEAERFTSGYGYTKMEYPNANEIEIERTQFAPDGTKAVLIGLTMTADESRKIELSADAHSELMSSYPWGETNPSQTDYNLEDEAAVENGSLVFTEQGTPDAENASEHDWAAVVGTSLQPTNSETGDGFRGPVTDPEVCPVSPDEAPERCDDTAYGRGVGGSLTYEVPLQAGTPTTIWFAVAGSDAGYDDARSQYEAALADPEGALSQKVASRMELDSLTDLDIPGDRQLEESIDWSKQNLADAVQTVDDLDIRETNAGENYPAPAGTLDTATFLAAGFPDYQWLFGTDGEYTAFASVTAGQGEPVKEHLRALRDISLVTNGDSGKVVHEVVYDGSVFFGSNADDGNTDETSKFPSAVALIWRWTGDQSWLEENYDYSKSNMEYIFRELDEDGDLWPEGLGNVEREGMGEEKLDNTVYTIRGLYDLADMANAMGDSETEAWAAERADEMMSRFDEDWWMPDVPQHADSLQQDGTKLQQRHWIGATPMEVQMPIEGERVYGLTTEERADKALDVRQTECYGDEYGMFHTGRAGCDGAGDAGIPSEEQAFTLNTGIIAVADGNYGRLEDQKKWTNANARLQLPDPDNAGGEPDEMPGAMPEIAPSPMNGPTIDRPLNERPMVHQAWGAYGTLWPVVHQQLGVAPDLGRGTLEVVPQVPPGSPGLSGSNIALGDGSVAVDVSAANGVYTTTVTPSVTANLIIGHTLPDDADIASVTLDGTPADYEVRDTKRGMEVVVDAGASYGATHTLVVAEEGAEVPDTGGPSLLMLTSAAMILAGILIFLLRRKSYRSN